MENLISSPVWAEPEKLSDVNVGLLNECDIFETLSKRVFIHQEKFHYISGIIFKVKSIMEGLNGAEFNCEPKHIYSIHQLQNNLHFLNSIAPEYFEDKWMDSFHKRTLKDVINIFISTIKSAESFENTFSNSIILNIFDIAQAHIKDISVINDNLSKNSQLPEVLSECQSFLNQSKSFSFYTIKSRVLLTSQSEYVIASKNTEDEIFLQLFDFHSDGGLLSHQSYETLSRITHPSIISVKNLLLPPICGIEYQIDNQKFTAFKNRMFNLTPLQKSITILQIARAFEYLHAHLIVHRNLNFESLFFTEDNTIKLGGFEYSRTLAPSLSGIVPFTPFVAPEIILPPGIYSEKVDVYSFAILIWSLVTNSNPDHEISFHKYKSMVSFNDYRPPIDKKFPKNFANFLIDAWASNPENRPDFPTIVKIIEKGELLFPETDINEFSQICAETQNDHTFALQGILTLKLSDITSICEIETLSDAEIELLIHVACNSKDSEMASVAKRRIIKHIQKDSNISYTRIMITHFVHFASKFPEVMSQVINYGKEYEGNSRIELIDILLERLLPMEAVEYIIKLGFDSEIECKHLLEFGLARGEEIAMKIASEVASKLPKSSLIFDYALRNQAYFKTALSLLTNLTAPELTPFNCYLQSYVEYAKGTYLEDLAVIVGRLQIPLSSFDETGTILTKFAQSQSSTCLKTVTMFCCSVDNCHLILSNVIPRVTNPVSKLSIIQAIVDRNFTECNKELLELPLLQIILAVVQAGEYEMAAKISISFSIPAQILDRNASISEELIEIGKKTENDINLSCIIVTLTPFALRLGWSEKGFITSRTAELLRSDNTLVASRALVFAVCIAQNPDIAKILAVPQNVEAVSRFLESSSKPPYSLMFFAVRFVGAIAPYLTVSEESMQISKLMIDVGIQSNNENFIITIAQSFAHLPKNEDWKAVLTKGTYPQFLQKMETFKSNQKMLKIVTLLKASL